MKKDTNKEKILKNRGFYIALVMCILAIGVAMFIGISATIDNLDESPNLEAQISSSQANTSEKQTDEEVLEDTQDVVQEVLVDEENIEQDIINQETSSQESAQEVLEEVQQTNTSPQEPQTQSQEESQETQTAAQVFMMPVEGEIINAFSNSELVKSKTLNDWRTHDGIDIKAQANTPVKATCDGTVEEITEDPMWGVCVTIKHENGYTSYYNGLKPNVSIKVGANIKIGDIVGYVGNTAEIEIAEESHVHFAMKKDDEWIDPVSMMNNNS